MADVAIAAPAEAADSLVVARSDGRPTGPTRKQRDPVVLIGQVVVLVATAVLWEFGSRAFKWEFWVSRPSLVWDQLVKWKRDGSLFGGLQVTMHATILGFLIGAFVGAVIGFVLGWFRRLGQVFEPFVLALYTLPKIALAPLFVLWFGIGMKPKVVMSAVLVFFLVFFQTFRGARTVDRSSMEMAYLMGGSKPAVFFKIVVPNSALWVFTGLKLSLPYALIGAVVGEFITSTEGIGFMIKNETNVLNTAGVFAGLVLLMSIAMAMTSVLGLIEKRFLRWMTVV